MARTFGLHIWASEKPFYDGECESLVIPSVDGKYGIMAGHSDLITAIVPGELKFTVPGKSPQIAAVSEGIMKIENNNVLVLVETIERPEEIDANRAAAAAEAAKEAMMQKLSRREYYTTRLTLARAMSRLQVKNRGNRGSEDTER